MQVDSNRLIKLFEFDWGCAWSVFRLIEVVQVVCAPVRRFRFFVVCFVLFWLVSSRLSLCWIIFRFCMLCSYVVLDLRCNYVAFSFFQVVSSCKRFIDRFFGCCFIAFRLFSVVLGCSSWERSCKSFALLTGSKNGFRRSSVCFELVVLPEPCLLFFQMFFEVVFGWLFCVVFGLSSKWGWCRLFQLVSVVSSRFILFTVI